MKDEWSWLVPVIVALIAAAAGWLSAKVQHKGKPENALIDQMQQEMKSIRLRMNGFEARDLVYIPHIIRLNMHIEQGLGPPAPKIPKVVQAYLDQKEEDDES
ncbi:hypothetical protein [Arthrobacter sp. SAFR-014]|uniref:hypothetical protein n=1 Tax=unclassified Arthrobacter TaxID=235627 RepID=UPI003F7BBBC4